MRKLSLEDSHGSIGVSAEGRPLAVLRRGGLGAARRILVVAGQHGDEGLGVEAVEALASDRSWVADDMDLEVALVPCLNPDGRAAGTRRTPGGVDLNRDHLRLGAPETQALHRFARGFDPELVIDVHTFKGRRKALKAHGLEHAADVLLAPSTYPEALRSPWRKPELGSSAVARLSDLGLRAGPYFVFDKRGRARSSSVDLVDLRNGLAASLGASGVLIEGREPTRRLGSAKRTRYALEAAVRSVVAEWTKTSPPAVARGAQVSIDARRGPPTPFEFWALRRGGAPPRYHRMEARTDLTTAPPIDVPCGYFVPPRPRLVALLHEHGFRPERAAPGLTGEALPLTRARPCRTPGGPWRRLKVPSAEAVQVPSEWPYYPCRGPRAHSLVRLLDPASRFALHRYADLDLDVSEGRHHPILRARDNSSP